MKASSSTYAKKVKRIRKAGKKAEREFFGKGGPLEVKPNPITVVGLANPPKWEPPSPWKVVSESKITRDKFILSSDGNVYSKSTGGWVNHGTLQEFTNHALKFWKPLKWMIDNPQDNPPRSVSANIEGIIYNRCIEIRAEKTGYKAGFYKHPFSKGSKVCIYGLDNGDLLIHSKTGMKLWQPD